MGKCSHYAENTLDCAEISTADKIDNTHCKPFGMYQTTVKQKACQSHSEFKNACHFC